jgi:Flp pilus assembly protein TadG
MMTRQRNRRSDERGATVVEAALVTPLFFFIIFALIELGPYFRQWSASKSAASEGGRAATTGGAASRTDGDMMSALRTPISHLGDNLDYVIVFRAASIKDEVPTQCVYAAEQGKTSAPGTKVGVFVPYKSAAAIPTPVDATNPTQTSNPSNFLNDPVGFNPYNPATVPAEWASQSDPLSYKVEDFDWAKGAPARACYVLYQRDFASGLVQAPYQKEKANIGNPRNVPTPLPPPSGPGIDPLCNPPIGPNLTPPGSRCLSRNRFWPSQLRIDYLNGPQDYVGVYVQSRYVGPTGIMQERRIRVTSINQVEPKTTDRDAQAT